LLLVYNNYIQYMNGIRYDDKKFEGKINFGQIEKKIDSITKSS